MPTDDELTAALALALDDAAALAPTGTDGRLAAAARRSGRRHRRHRLALTGALTVLALGATGAVVGHLPSGPGGPATVQEGDFGPATAEAERRSSVIVTAQWPGSPTPTHAIVFELALPSDDAAPDRGVQQDRTWRSDSYSVTLHVGQTAGRPEQLLCPTPDELRGLTCKRSVQPDGSVAVVVRGPLKNVAVRQDAPVNGYSLQGVRVFPDGRQVALFELYRDTEAEPVVSEEEFVTASEQTGFPQLDALPSTTSSTAPTASAGSSELG
ncbi:hypothetical protein Kpho02_31180 [Kitasatospora phosalacinea]|uniref:Uncharacterized protein n=1 Tax=Kitasatospora phosalacinea TaxID=2065 RepID=A0A9W6V0G8_9ACTN|nr:hypothetical protein [Kitasatospora phosalacinea]GLW70819.1 hypothetical protein Kpho02_31180 [Kitasatospora phosalacinea]